MGHFGARVTLTSKYGRVVAAERPETALARDIEFLDGVRALPAAAVRKETLVETLGVTPGALVVEIGPGTGEDLQRFAVAAGTDGVAVGVDVSFGLAFEAKRRAVDAGVKNAVFVIADARRLP